MLEENYCFDAEAYADELDLEEKIDFREDHRSACPRILCKFSLILCSKSWQMDPAIPLL